MSTRYDLYEYGAGERERERREERREKRREERNFGFSEIFIFDGF